MDLDRKIPARHRDRAMQLLSGGGFDVTRELLIDCDLRTLTWTLGGAKPNRRKTVLELLSLVLDEEAA